jgi:hypothetical protein
VEQTVAMRVVDRFGSGVDAEFSEQIADVGPRGGRADEEVLRDLGVGPPRRHQPQHLGLPRREPGPGVDRGRPRGQPRGDGVGAGEQRRRRRGDAGLLTPTADTTEPQAPRRRHAGAPPCPKGGHAKKIGRAAQTSPEEGGSPALNTTLA